MSEANALKSFEFPKSDGLFLTFSNGDEYKLRILTVDPVVSTSEFEGADGQVNISTKFAFIVYNFTLGKAQILNAGASITKEIQRIHQDEDFGADIRKVDIKVTATGEKLTRKYTINVLPKTETLTNDQIRECAAIKLEEKIKNGTRMSLYNREDYNKSHVVPEEYQETSVEKDDPINLDEIPF